MGRQKKSHFKLNPDWMLKKPIDFEYNKYTLLNYLQKCEQRFNNLELYPDFVELSLHLVNVQSLNSKKNLLITKKTFESCDDEILLKDLMPKKTRQLTNEELEELDKTIKFSGTKLLDAFNIAKSIWNLAYDNIEVNLKRNKNNLSTAKGFAYFYRKSNNKIYIWEYHLKKPHDELLDNKTILTLIYESEPSEVTLNYILETCSTWNEDDSFKDLPIFEMKCTGDFPMEQTFVPIIKRKIMAHIFQVVHLDNINNFDT